MSNTRAIRAKFTANFMPPGKATRVIRTKFSREEAPGRHMRLELKSQKKCQSSWATHEIKTKIT